MISPSDSVLSGIPPAAAGNLFNEVQPLGSVLPLQFEKIDHPLRRKTDAMWGQEEESYSRDKMLHDQLAKLESRFHAQTQQVAEQLAEATHDAKLEARREWEAELAERIAVERERIAQIGAEFVATKTAYFAAVEGEVVRLALAVAARVLHREAKLDPMLLGAVVRVALEKVAEDSGAVLHVPLADVDAWQTMLAGQTTNAVRVVGEERMSAAECVLETSMGRVELGVVAQMEEIEKGFFDLLQQRPV